MKPRYSQRIAFSGTGEGEGNVFVCELDGSDARVMFTSDHPVRHIAWAGDHIYVEVLQRVDEPGEQFSETYIFHFITNIETGEVRELELPSDLYFARFVSNGERMFWSDFADKSISVDLFGKDEVLCAPMHSDTLSPDESRWCQHITVQEQRWLVIQFDDWRDDYPLVLQGETPDKIASAWSPDSIELLLVHEDEAMRHHCVIFNSEKRESRDFPVPLHRMYAVAWSPDGRQIAVVGYFPWDEDDPEAETGPQTLIVIPVAGGSYKRLSTTNVLESRLLWTNDSRHIVFEQMVCEAAEDYRLHVYNLESGVATVINTPFNVADFALEK